MYAITFIRTGIDSGRSARRFLAAEAEIGKGVEELEQK
jgi:hypothetical protein